MSSTVLPFSNRIRGDIDIASGRGALGDCTRLNGITADFSINPLSNTIWLTKLYSNYIISTESSVAMTLPPISYVSNGWNTTIYFNSIAGKITVLDNAAVLVGVLNPQFSAQIINAYGSWRIVFLVPPTQSSNNLVAYDSAGFPLLRPLVYNQFYARTSTASSLNVLTPVAVKWNANISQDSSVYSVNTSTGVITLTLTGSYIFNALIGINTLLGGLLTNMQFRVRRNGSTIDPSYANAGSLIVGPGAYYDFRASAVYPAGTTIEIIGNKTILNIVGDTVIDITATFLQITYIP